MIVYNISTQKNLSIEIQKIVFCDKIQGLQLFTEKVSNFGAFSGIRDPRPGPRSGIRGPGSEIWPIIIRDPGSGIWDPGSGFPHPGSQIPDPGCWILEKETQI